MPNPETVASLFQDKPGQWGLRGDPYLWQEMADHFAHTPLPATAAELRALLETAFETLTGYPLSTDEKFFFIERFSHGGMSSGLVAPAFWRDKALPLLCGRLGETF